MIESKLYKELGELTKNKDRWKESITSFIRGTFFCWPPSSTSCGSERLTETIEIIRGALPYGEGIQIWI